MLEEARETSVKSRDLRDTLSEVLRQVEQGERVVVQKYSSPVAVIVPLSDYLTLKRLDAQLKQPPLVKEKRMAHRIVVSNISGGEGKTSITRELALTLASEGYKVALIDGDPQASLTKTLGLHDPVDGVSRNDLPGRRFEHSIGPVFEDGDAPRLGEPLHALGVDIWVSNDHLYQVDAKIAADLTMMGNLREALDHVADRYDFVLIDTKPGITPLLNAAMAAADHLIVPVSGDKGLENLDKLTKLMKGARTFSPGFQILMFVPNRVRSNTNTYRTLLSSLQAYTQLAPLSSLVRDSVVVMDAQRDRKPVVQYKSSSDVAQDFRSVTRDVLVGLGVVTADAAEVAG